MATATNGWYMPYLTDETACESSTTINDDWYSGTYSKGSSLLSAYVKRWYDFDKLALAKQKMNYVASTASSEINWDGKYVGNVWNTITYGNGTATYNNTSWYEYSYGESDDWAKSPRRSPQELLRDILTKRQSPGMRIVQEDRFWTPARFQRKARQAPQDVREIRARETLLRMLGSSKMRRYLRDGFVTARNSKSGRTYQIFPGHGITCVYEQGTMVERLCVVLRGDFPPTDSLIVRYLLALNDEERLWTLGIKHSVYKERNKPKVVELDTRPLAEIFQELKLQAA